MPKAKRVSKRRAAAVEESTLDELMTAIGEAKLAEVGAVVVALLRLRRSPDQIIEELRKEFENTWTRAKVVSIPETSSRGGR